METLRLVHAPADPEIRVVLADDHHLVRRSLRLLLESEDGISVVGEAGDLHTTILHVRQHAPHVLLLDLRMPNGSSIEAIRGLRAEAPDTAIVVVTMENHPLFARRALDAGAVGYVLKDHADDELAHAVRLAARGQEYVSRRVAARLDAFGRVVDGDRLSPRETEVLRLIALGYTSSEIAEQLHLSSRTVETHRRRLHRKLGLSRRSELVQYALGRDLIGLEPAGD
ncbi:MAG: response regulator [Solirubrobacteraceae bacterium]